MTVQVLLPGVLAELVGGARRLTLDARPGTVGGLLDALAERHPRLVSRVRDETGEPRRYVNIYVDGNDVRGEGGLLATVADGAVVHILPSVAGG